ncbi:BrnA antitoxin family protein [Methylobacterium aquaticum]|uniref:BrnA antitoxin family protein n=1 Tax=Methylobacterium aquaticum TaxID=270351 RepID=UPI001932EBD2|nr:BrnA antitoxin family protein [Methylobacterium aquaticum]QRE76967.1 BrnA antitoxin family protein [Methylobacterium aquaticum]
MSPSKPATPTFSPDAYGATDFAKVDAHIITAEDYDELPELTEADLEAADIDRGATLIRRGRGRPPVTRTKKLVTLRLDPDVVERWRASGPGWQTRMNAVLRRAMP